MYVWVIVAVLGAAVFPFNEASTGCGKQAKHFLGEYGYLDRTRLDDFDDDDVKGALCVFQLFTAAYGLNDTGKCDENTLGWMGKPRCGCEDMLPREPKMVPQNIYGPQEYNIGSTKWIKKHLTWTVTKYPRRNNHLSKEEVDGAMKRGLQIWADRTTLTFQQVTGNDADITISFEERRHTSQPPYYDFDGPSGTLAHAFFPRSGVVHFDDEESFTLGNNEGTELYIVAAHEFGHTLGISHSNIKEALMAPYYRYSPDLKLHYDDVGAVQALYGRNTNPVPRTTTRPVRTTERRTFPTRRPPTTPARKPDAPPECDMVITASFKYDRHTYVFTRVREQKWRRVTYVYKVHESQGLDLNSKTNIKDMFLNDRQNPTRFRPYPRRVDAAVYLPDFNKVFLFSGTRLYRYKIVSGRFYIDSENNYPKWVNVQGFPERPRAVIAKQYGNNVGPYYVIILSESMLWVWDPYKERVNGIAYTLKSFGHMMPQSIDSAFSISQDVVYMFRGQKIYTFDVRQWRITQEDDGKALVYQFLKGPCIKK